MRLKKKVFIIQICIIAFFIVGCSKSPQDYYPMKENTTMKYKIVMETRKRDNINSNSIDIKKTDMELERVFLSPEKLKEKEVFPIKQNFGNNRVSYLYVTKEKDGYAMYAEKGMNAKEPTIHNDPKYFIKNPIEVGNKWDYKGVMINAPNQLPVTLVCNIDSITDSVSVPMGTFEKCLIVKCEGQAEFSYPLLGTIKFNNSIRWWFAPGVGIVKSEQINSCSLDTIPTSTTYMELISKK